jgi:glutathione-specific gamma-glutamylcyclotransferase
MMALDEGGSCEGVIYDLQPHDQPAQLEKLLRREMTNKPPTNMPMIVELEASGKIIRALTFKASKEGENYQGKLPLEEMAHILARSAGHWGTCAEYLYNTVSHLEQLGIRDDILWELQKRVAKEIESLN